MRVSRRQMLHHAAALPLACARPSLVRADVTLGSATLTTVSDGTLMLPGSFVFEAMPQDELAQILTELDISQDRLAPECNLALYQDGTNTPILHGPSYRSPCKTADRQIHPTSPKYGQDARG